MFGPSFTSRLGQRISKRMASTNSPGKVARFDLILWDHQVLDPSEARILVGFTKDMGIPTRSDVDDWVLKNFGGQVRVILESMRVHADKPIITANVVQIPAVRPLMHSRNMVKVAGDAFMDEKEAVWKVHKTEKGERYLMLAARDAVDTLLTSFEKQSRSAAVHRRPRLAEVWAEMQVNPEIGDRVAFTSNGLVQHGLVQRIYPNGTLKVAADGKSMPLEKSKILEVKKVPDMSEEEHKRKMIEFFTKAYGDRGFATKLVNG